MSDPAAVSMGQRGGKAKWAKLAPAERAELMRQVAIAGWAKRPRAAKPRKRKAKAPTNPLE